MTIDIRGSGYDARCLTRSAPSRVDQLTLYALQAGTIHVDPESGLITDRAGKAAVYVVRRDASGRVMICKYPREVWAPAHRVVWIAVHGLIPARTVVRHHNRCRWDNRPSNLYLSRSRGCITYPDVTS